MRSNKVVALIFCLFGFVLATSFSGFFMPVAGSTGRSGHVGRRKAEPMKRTNLWLLVAACVGLISTPARADCSNPSAPEGKMLYNQTYHVPTICNGSDWEALGALNPAAGGAGCSNPAAPEGRILYNADYHVLQFCDGDDWIAATQARSDRTGPSGCANIGDLCADGTVFAGWHPITQAHLFIPTTDQGTTSQWKTSTGTDDIATDSIDDGESNTNQVANSTTFPAFKLCKDLATGGHSDWYLPSQVELYYLWSVRGTIEAGGNITNFQNVNYWSSTEINTNFAWNQNFTNGSQYSGVKNSAYRVRCVRR